MIVLREKEYSKKPIDIYIMIGPAGSGKSTWIKENLDPKIPTISRDLVREELGIIGKDGRKAMGSSEQEDKISEICDRRMRKYLNSKTSFVIDNTNLGKSLNNTILFLRRYPVNLIGVRINTPLNIIIKRRPEIPKDILSDMYKRSQRIDKNLFDKFIDVK